MFRKNNKEESEFIGRETIRWNQICMHSIVVLEAIHPIGLAYYISIHFVVLSHGLSSSKRHILIRNVSIIWHAINTETTIVAVPAQLSLRILRGDGIPER